MSVLGRRSAAKLTAKELAERNRKAAQALWADLTPEQRSVEMKRRARVRERNRAAKAKASKKRKPKGLNSSAGAVMAREEAIQALSSVKNDVDAALGRPRR
jgi:hypothetical protein